MKRVVSQGGVYHPAATGANMMQECALRGTQGKTNEGRASPGYSISQMDRISFFRLAMRPTARPSRNRWIEPAPMTEV